MDVKDYLLDHSSYDWSLLLRDFHTLLPSEFTMWLMNRFGELFIIAKTGEILHLDPSNGSLKEVAASREVFCDLIDREEKAQEWLMVPLVSAAVSAGLTLGPGQCYRFKTLPLFGGEYSISNIFVGDLVEHFRFSGDIYLQTKDLPDGAKIKLKVTD
jgi:hypothetical protein